MPGFQGFAATFLALCLLAAARTALAVTHEESTECHTDEAPLLQVSSSAPAKRRPVAEHASDGVTGSAAPDAQSLGPLWRELASLTQRARALVGEAARSSWRGEALSGTVWARGCVSFARDLILFESTPGIEEQAPIQKRPLPEHSSRRIIPCIFEIHILPIMGLFAVASSGAFVAGRNGSFVACRNTAQPSEDEQPMETAELERITLVQVWGSWA